MKKNYFIAMLALVFSFTITQAQVKISQVFGGGGNSGATIKHDFIQLKNTATSGSPIDISGWSVQYASSTGTSWGTPSVIPASTTLAPGQYYLIRQAAGSGGTDLAPVDFAVPAATAISMAGASGKVALVNNSTALTGAQPTGATIVDLVGYGVLTAANQVEGPSTGTALTSTTSVTRKNNGCTDTDSNLNDFVVVAATAPIKSSASSVEICSTGPSISIVSPANGAILSPEALNTDITLSVDNFNVAIMGMGNGWIKVSINGAPFTDKFDTTPVNIGLIAGANTVTVKLVDNTGADLVPNRTATVTINKASYTMVTDIAALRTDVTANGIGKYYQLSTNPIVSYTRTSRNQKYVQDTSAGILIDDNVGVITTTLAVGDAVGGLKGQSVLFAGILQINPIANATQASTGNTVVVQDLTLAAFVANYANYESEMIRITDNVTFTGTNYTLTTSQNFPITSGADTAQFRTLFSEAPYIGTLRPTTAQNITALGGKVSIESVDNPAIFAPNLTGATLSAAKFSQIEGLKMYPNPASTVLNIETALNNQIAVEIFDIVGKQVLNTKVSNNTVNIQNLNTGIYVVKITENCKTATQKLIVE